MAAFMKPFCFSGDNNSIPHSIRIFSEKISHDVKTCAIICEIIKKQEDLRVEKKNHTGTKKKYLQRC